MQAARLLKEAADFYQTLGRQNPNARDEFTKKALSFLEVADRVAKAPDEETERPDPQLPDHLRSVFATRPTWWHAGFGSRGDLLEFSSRADRICWEATDTDNFRALFENTLDEMASEEDSRRLAQASLWTCPAPFYPDAQLYHAVDEEGDALFVAYTEQAGKTQNQQLAALGADMHDLHRVNIAAPLILDGRELDYLLLFMHVISGPDGKFRLVRGPLLDRIGEILAAEADLLRSSGKIEEAEEVEGVLTQLRPPRFQRFSGKGGCHYEALVLYSDHLFRSQLQLSYGGEVVMLDDEPLVQHIDFSTRLGLGQ